MIGQVRVLFVHNRHAGLHRPACPIGPIRSALHDWGWRVDDMACRGGETRSRVRSAVRAHAYDRVVVAGGDGTLHLTLNGAAEAAVPFILIPCGTGNDLARSLEIPLDWHAALDVARTGELIRIDLGTVNDRLFVNAASLGVGAHVARDLPAARKRRWGRVAYALETVRRVRRHETQRVEVCAGGRCETLDIYQLSVANGSSFGGGFRVTRDAALDDARLDVVIFEPGLGRLLRGSERGASVVERLGSRSFKTQRLLVSAGRRMLVNLDGEPTVLASPLQFGVLPAALSIMVPRPEQRSRAP